MIKFEEYIKEIKKQLHCNCSDDEKNKYITYMYTNKQVDDNLDYFKKCNERNLSPYKSLLFFNDYIK